MHQPRHRLTEWMKTCACMHFHLPHHSAWHTPIVCHYFVKLIMFPLWLAIVIIFYFLFGYCLWKLIRIFHYCGYEMATHSSVLAWKTLRMEETGRLYSPWGHKESDTTEWLTLTLTITHLIPLYHDWSTEK